MILIDPTSKEPTFQQICDGILRDIGSGAKVAGERLPTVRDMADELNLAANTVTKAYKQLGAEGHVVTRGRNGTFVSDDHTGAPLDDSTAAARLFAQAAQRGGLTVNEAIGLLRRCW